MNRRRVNFTVDAALLRELGARLVGKPHIALAELIKNAYDADARHVRIVFDGDSIVVEDDGHGMSARTFENYWMRVGTTHKADERRTPELGRPLTGSKGVGRLAAQLLASDLAITSVSLINPKLEGYARRSRATTRQLHPMLKARIDWDKAVERNELTKVSVPIVEGGDRETFVGGSKTGTRLVLTDLASQWGEDDFQSLAREIWALQPPFDVDPDDEQAFQIELVSDFGDVVSEFGQQMNRIFDTWQGHVTLRLIDDQPRREVLFEFDALRDYVDDDEDDDEARARRDADLAKWRRRDIGSTKLLHVKIDLKSPSEVSRNQYIRIPNCPIDELSADVRVFNLTNRQAYGISVKDAREYMRAFGGIHIYDDKFRLPYYGPEDWLSVERDHARRLSRSQLVPAALRVSKGLHDLPSRRRLFGTATISTAHEQETARERNLSDTEALAIQVTRDRLSDNIAYVGLRNLVRLSLDLYATEVARAKGAATTAKRDGSAPPPRPTEDLRAVRDAVSAARSNLTTGQYQSITDYLTDAETKVQTIEETADSQASLLGTLATVGMTTLAWDHESAKQRLVVLDAAEALQRASSADAKTLREVASKHADRLSEAAQRMNDVARLFRPVIDRESRETRATLPARRFVQRTAKHLSVLGRGAEVDTKRIPRDLVLPPGTFAAWSAVLQNLLVNAFNAVLEEDVQYIEVDGGTSRAKGWLRIQDTGTGIDLKDAESFFLPFARGMADDPRRAQLGLGGSGLGLTIVRMITDTMGVTVRFAEPDDGFSTAVQLEWKTSK